MYLSGTLFLLLPLAACSEKNKQVRGLVTEIQTGPDGTLTAFAVQTWGGEQVGVLLTEDTFAAPSRSGRGAAFQAELLPDASISAVCLPSKKKLTAQDGQEIAAYEVDTIYINGRLESFDDLSTQTQEKVSAWYEDWAPLFDEAAELEKAYSDWKATGEDFQGHMVNQSTSPSASSERVLYPWAVPRSET